MGMQEEKTPNGSYHDIACASIQGYKKIEAHKVITIIIIT